MYEGYLEFSNTELINVERTEAYVRNLSSIAFTPRFGSTTLHVAAEEDPYTSPTIDQAPWFSDAERTTTDFYGFYPLEITGVDDSTMVATVTENLGDGGTTSGSRDGSRAIRVHGLLVAASREGAMAGLSWLREAVRSTDCGDDSACSAGDLRYFVTEPDVTPLAFSSIELAPQSQGFGTVNAPQRVDMRWNNDEIDPTMPSRLRWSVGTLAEGTLFEVGGLDRMQPTELFRSEQIAALRSNYVPNPTVRSGTDGWTGLGAGTLQWQPTGGVDGASAGRVAGVDETGSFVQADSALLLDDGSRLAATDGSDIVLGGDAEGVGGVSTLTELVPAGDATASIFLRADLPGSVTFAVYTDAGEALGSAGVDVGPDWVRAVIPLQLAADSRLELRLLAPSAFDFDQALVEVGATVLDYFDARDGTDPDPDYTTEWLGTPDASVSRRRWLAHVVDQAMQDSDFRPFIRVLQGQLNNVTLTWWPLQSLSMSEQLDPVERVLHEVTCTQGPQVINSYFTPLGSYIEVDLIFVAGNPHPYSNGTVISTMPLTSVPWADWADPSEPDAAWLVDPRQPVITAPPSAPKILDPSLETYAYWQRYYVSVPASAVQEWGISVPVLGIDTGASDLSQIRIRFHPNPFDYDAQTVDPLAYCSEVIVSYLPAWTRLVLDGMNRKAIASKSGKATVPADHLLYGSDGGPIAWPELSCGIPYVLTIDVPRGEDLPDPLDAGYQGGFADQGAFDVDLVMKRRS